MHKDYDDVFNGIGCFEGTFSLQLKADSKPYQAPLRYMAYALQMEFQGEVRKAMKTWIL